MASRPRKILITIGNPLRGDDGVAHRVLQRLGANPACDARSVLQLTPELAAEIAPYQTVIFLDADAEATTLRIEPLPSRLDHSPLSHVVGSTEIVALAMALFGFSGMALLCRIPAADFSAGPELSPGTDAAVNQCVRLLQLRRPHGRHLLGEKEPGDEQAPI